MITMVIFYGAEDGRFCGDLRLEISGALLIAISAAVWGSLKDQAKVQLF
jgi:hypothetical protein